MSKTDRALPVVVKGACFQDLLNARDRLGVEDDQLLFVDRADDVGWSFCFDLTQRLGAEEDLPWTIIDVEKALGHDDHLAADELTGGFADDLTLEDKAVFENEQVGLRRSDGGKADDACQN